jgi:hypothetical protein
VRCLKSGLFSLSRGLRTTSILVPILSKQPVEFGGLLWSVSVAGNEQLTFHTLRPHPDGNRRSAAVLTSEWMSSTSEEPEWHQNRMVGNTVVFESRAESTVDMNWDGCYFLWCRFDHVEVGRIECHVLSLKPCCEQLYPIECHTSQLETQEDWLCARSEDRRWLQLTRECQQSTQEFTEPCLGAYLKHNTFPCFCLSRSAYCAASVASLTNILTPDLFEGTAEWIARWERPGFPGLLESRWSRLFQKNKIKKHWKEIQNYKRSLKVIWACILKILKTFFFQTFMNVVI